MAEYINREAVITEANHNKAVGMAIADIVDIKEILNNIPTADVAPVKHGIWKCRAKHLGECSECGEVVATRYKYCPNCGARMDGDTP